MNKLWNKNFVLLIQGNGFSIIGDILYSVAIGYWVLEKTGSTALMGIMSSISMFTTMFLMPLAGTIVDRIERKIIIVGMDFIRGILMLVIGFLAMQDYLSIPIVLLASAIASLCAVFFSPAIETVLLDIIPRSEFLRGQSISRGITSFISLVGKAISGMLVAFFGVPLIIVLNGISFLISAFSEYFIDIPRLKNQSEEIHLNEIGIDFVEGAKSIIKHPVLQILIPCSLCMNLLGSGIGSMLMPFCMEKGYSLDQYGILMACMTAASLFCVSVLATIKLSGKQRYYALAAGFIAYGIFTIPAYLSKSFILLLGLTFLATFGNAIGNSIFDASFMLALPEEKRGVILGFVYATSSGGQALSTLIYGFLGEYISLEVIFIVGTFLAMFPTIFVCFHKRTKEFIISNS